MEREKSLELATTVAIAAALAALVAWSFWVRWSILTETPFPVGIDGYFYPIQLRSLLEHGGLAYPASPLAFWMMAPLAKATDPITGAKLGAALFTALIALPAYGVGTRLGGNRGTGLIAAALATTSAGSMFLTIEFVKNGIGLTIGLTALWLVLRAFERRSMLRIALALLAVIAAFLAHKSAAAFVIAIAVPAALAEASSVGALRGRRLLYALGVLVVLAAIALVLGIVSPERFLSVEDARHQLWGDAQWMLPALATKNVTLTMGHEALIGVALAIGAAVVLWRNPGAIKRRPADRKAAWAIVVLAFVFALPWLAVGDPQGLGFRIRIIAFLPMALCAAIVAGGLVQLVPTYREVALGVIALVIVSAMPRVRTQGRVLAHPAMVAAVQGLAGRIPEGSIAIVPERHIAFMVTWYTGTPSRQRPEPVPREKRWRVMPLAFLGAGSPLDEAVTAARNVPDLAPPIGTHPRHANGLVLVPEPTWEWILARLPPSTREQFTRWPTI
ncbi:MAG: glycosyltransferase family 39 protein [Deltaproteobacteria bacterium]|nr:glycosyltransferase family 39 protein [Deltaproteobacteria bacterium]